MPGKSEKGKLKGRAALARLARKGLIAADAATVEDPNAWLRSWVVAERRRGRDWKDIAADLDVTTLALWAYRMRESITEEVVVR